MSHKLSNVENISICQDHLVVGLSYFSLRHPIPTGMAMQTWKAHLSPTHLISTNLSDNTYFQPQICLKLDSKIFINPESSD